MRNKARRSQLRTETRKFLDAVHDGNVDAARSLYTKLTKRIDQVAAKGTLHRNTAARKKSRMAGRLNAMQGSKA